MELAVPSLDHLHFSSPQSRLQSPEPSGSPDMKHLASYRSTTAFGFTQMTLSGDGQSSASFFQQKVPKAEYTTSNFFAADGGNQFLGNPLDHLKPDIFRMKDDHLGYFNDSNYEGADNGILQVNGPLSQMCANTEKCLIEACETEEAPSKSSWLNVLDDASDGKDYDHATGHGKQQNSKQESVERMHMKFRDLVKKLTKSIPESEVIYLQGDPSLKLSSSVSLPIKGHKSTPTIVELQRKVQYLKNQVILEKGQRQAIAQRLNELRHENSKNLHQNQKQWEAKMRELQKEKYMLSMQLQKLHAESPKQQLSRGSEIHLTEEELKALRQEISEQESLINGYQLENERAIKKLKEVQAEAKERERLLSEENGKLASQLASLHVTIAPRTSYGGHYGSLEESLSLRADLQDSRDREAALVSEMSKLRSDNQTLQHRITELEELVTAHKRMGPTVHQDKLDEHENLVESVKDDHKHSVRSDANECHMEAKQLTDKENMVHCDEMLEKKQNNRKEREITTLKMKMEKMKLDYEIQIRRLKQQNQKQPPVIRQFKTPEQTTPKKVKDLEIQIDEIRSFYSKKIKALTEALDASKKEKKLVHANLHSSLKKGLLSKKMQELKKAQEHIILLEDCVTQKEIAMKHLKKSLYDSENSASRGRQLVHGRGYHFVSHLQRTPVVHSLILSLLIHFSSILLLRGLFLPCTLFWAMGKICFPF